MQTDDLILVSVDDHVVEPPDMFEGRVPSRYADVAPRLERVSTTGRYHDELVRVGDQWMIRVKAVRWYRDYGDPLHPEADNALADLYRGFLP